MCKIFQYSTQQKHDQKHWNLCLPYRVFTSADEYLSVQGKYTTLYVCES